MIIIAVVEFGSLLNHGRKRILNKKDLAWISSMCLLFGVEWYMSAQVTLIYNRFTIWFTWSLRNPGDRSRNLKIWCCFVLCVFIKPHWSQLNLPLSSGLLDQGLHHQNVSSGSVESEFWIKLRNFPCDDSTWLLNSILFGNIFSQVVHWKLFNRLRMT